MSGEKLFGGPARNAVGNSDHDGLKLVLHRYIIDAIEESGQNLLEGTRQTLAQFVIDKVSEYIMRMRLAISRYEMERLAEEIVDELTGFGPLEVLLRDPAVTEILVNGPHRVFIEREGLLHQSDLRFIDDHHVERVMQRILAPLGRRLDESSPMVDARLPDGSRVNAIIPPIALDGPCLSIRKFRKDMLKSSDLVAMQTIDHSIFEFFQDAVGKRCNILISGGTGTGKTTLLNILSQLINPHERLVTIEDVAELQLGHPHVVRLETRPPNAEGHGEVRSSDLIRNALRMRPDRIILGEIRGVEVLDVMTAMNTGHDGSMSTVHANNAQDALLRQREKQPAFHPWIAVHAEQDSRHIRIWVADNGGGIDPRLLERIFEPFFTTKPIGVGTGLGLSVSYGIIENMGGRLSVTNGTEGARFCVELPLAEA